MYPDSANMHLLPTSDEVVRLLRETGALRDGHFAYPNGLHSNEYLQIPLAMRFYDKAKILNVGLSRKLRANSELRAAIPQLSIVAPATAGLPVAYGICEALQARRVYWAERDNAASPQRFRQYIEPEPGEQVVLVDDILRSGRNLKELKAILESYGAEVLALAVIVYQPTPKTHDFGKLPVYYLSKLEASYYSSAEDCVLCKAGTPIERAWV